MDTHIDWSDAFEATDSKSKPEKERKKKKEEKTHEVKIRGMDVRVSEAASECVNVLGAFAFIHIYGCIDFDMNTMSHTI